MVKFLLSLPLGIFIAAEAIVVYMLGDIIFKAATDSTAAGLVGSWNFFQVVLAMVGITIGIILAAFFYSTVVLKPVFYPPLEEEKPKKQKRMMMPEPKKKSKKPLIILLILGIIIVAAGVTGFIFREQIFDFIAAFTEPKDNESDEDNAESEDNEEEVTTEPETESEPEPEVPEDLYYADLDFNWTMYYPPSLALQVKPLEIELLREPSDTDTKLLYWSTDNTSGYAGAEDYEAADPSGILSTAIETQTLNDNVIICRYDSDLDGEPFSGVRYWYIDPDGIASVDIPCETAEKADEWYASLADEAVYIEKTSVPEDETETE